MKSRYMSATIVFVVAALLIAGLQPAAFAAPPENAKSEESAQNAPKALPNRPVIVTTSVPSNAPIAQALPNPAPRPATSSVRTPYTPPARQNTGKSKKWIWIVAAAAGAAITTGILIAQDDDPEEATITLGTPVVGGPQ